MNVSSPISDFVRAPAAGASYSPDQIELMEHALEDVCRRAAPHVQMNDALRSSLALAILEGVKLGLRGDQLESFALRPLPSLRGSQADI